MEKSWEGKSRGACGQGGEVVGEGGWSKEWVAGNGEGEVLEG